MSRDWGGLGLQTEGSALTAPYPGWGSGRALSAQCWGRGDGLRGARTSGGRAPWRRLWGTSFQNRPFPPPTLNTLKFSRIDTVVGNHLLLPPRNVSLSHLPRRLRGALVTEGRERRLGGTGAPPRLRSRFRDEAAHAETATARVPVRAPAPDGPGGRATFSPLTVRPHPGLVPVVPSLLRPSVQCSRHLVTERCETLQKTALPLRLWPSGPLLAHSLFPPGALDPVLLQKTRSCFL